MHEISNDGARRKFQNFLENDILPIMVKVAQVSDCYCLLWCTDNWDHIHFGLVHWDLLAWSLKSLRWYFCHLFHE